MTRATVGHFKSVTRENVLRIIIRDDNVPKETNVLVIRKDVFIAVGILYKVSRGVTASGLKGEGGIGGRVNLEGKADDKTSVTGHVLRN